MNKVKAFIRRYFSRFAIISIPLLLVSVIILIISKLSSGFADFFNRYISSSIRYVLANITDILPFSLGETVFLCLPVIFVVLIIVFNKKYCDEIVRSVRFLLNIVGCIAILFSVHMTSFGVAYNCTPLDQRLGIEAKAVTALELEYTASCLLDEIEALLDDIYFDSKGASSMELSFSELNENLNDCYGKMAEKYSFIPSLRSNVKLIAASDLMTYTHISGIYTYYTGEANVNFNYPDYNFPFTMAHEMAHQRGIAPEDEANFVAFLACMESDEPYIRYSACMNVFEYVLSAFSETDAAAYSAFISNADIRVKLEMVAYSEFFDQYRDSVASDITNAINDTYLKASGESAGSKSYGLVVDLACAYFHE